MSGGEIALDTNQTIAVLNGAGDAAQWILAFTKVYLPVPVVGELRFGALNSQRGKTLASPEPIPLGEAIQRASPAINQFPAPRFPSVPEFFGTAKANAQRDVSESDPSLGGLIPGVLNSQAQCVDFVAGWPYPDAGCGIPWSVLVTYDPTAFWVSVGRGTPAEATVLVNGDTKPS
jgi:hypothetical protein